MSILIPSEQAKRQRAALAERLGVDPEHLTSPGFTIHGGGGEATIEWRGVVVLPEQEVIDLLNGA